MDRPRDAVWSALLPELGKLFFVINNIDKSSGLLNISYTGDPERYIDCGQIISYVENSRGKRIYDFPGAKASKSYEILNPGVGLFTIDRRMNLEGRVNIILEEISPSSTRVSVNSRYLLTRTQIVQEAAQRMPLSQTDVIQLNTGASASFPSAFQEQVTVCVPTGALEREILSVIK